MSGATSGSRFRLPLFLRFALRELRGGLRGFYIVLACIALGAGTIAAVNSLAEGLSDSITEEGQAILGGDMAFSLIHRQASPEERAFLESLGTLSTAATLRGMARINATDQTLVEVKGVDDLYPLYGTLDLTSGEPLATIVEGAPEGTVPTVVDESFLAARDLSVGDQFGLGNLTLTVMDTIEREPDRLAGGVAFGPRVIVPLDALDASGLTGTGSLVRWRYRVAGPDGPMSEPAIEAAMADAESAFPSAGWRMESRTEAAPGLRDSIDQFAQFLTLVGLTSLAVGGIGVANAVRAYLLNKRPVLATLRTMGAPAGLVFRIYMAQVLMISCVGILIGLGIGAITPPLAALALDGLLPVSALQGVFPMALVFAALFGLLTAITFSLLPTARTVSIPPVAIFREDDVSVTLPRSAWIGLALSAAALCALILLTGYDPVLGASYIAGAAVLFVTLRLLAAGIQWVASRLPRSRSPIVRLAVANLHRPGALTPTVTVALGLSLTLLVALSLVDANIRNALVSRLPEKAPTFFFVDIQDREKDAVLELLAETAPAASIASEPLLRGRIVSINGIAARDWPPTEADWVLRGDRGITYDAESPANATVVDGAWWSPDSPNREVSFDDETAAELGVGVGDVVRVNVLGREVDATISNLRTVEWESLGINFVMIFSPATFAGAPHGHLATLTLPDGEDEATELSVLRAMTAAFPTVTSIRVRDALETVNGVVRDLALAIRSAAAVTLVASILVLAGTLAAGHSARIYDAVVMKTLGARRRTITLAYALEYLMLSLAAGLIAVVFGSAAAYAIVTFIMKLDFILMPSIALGLTVGAAVMIVALGLIGTWRALAVPAARVLRTN